MVDGDDDDSDLRLVSDRLLLAAAVAELRLKDDFLEVLDRCSLTIFCCLWASKSVATAAAADPRLHRNRWSKWFCCAAAAEAEWITFLFPGLVELLSLEAEEGDGVEFGDSQLL